MGAAGEGKDFTKYEGFYFSWNLEQQTTERFHFASLAKGEAVQPPILGMCEPDSFLWSFCVVTALLSGPQLSGLYEKTFPLEEDGLWRNFLRSMSFRGSPYPTPRGVFVLDTLFLEMPRFFGVNIKWTTHHICCRLDTFCLVGFVTSYIMQNYFCTNCLKVIYARFECIPVFLLF